MFETILNSPSLWDEIKNSDLPLVCYGTGNGADKIFDEFKRQGITVNAVMASDGFVRSRSFREFKVKSYKECLDEFGDFNVCVCFGSFLPEVINNIKQISAAHNTFIPTVSVCGNDAFTADFFNENLEKIESSYMLFADEKSKEVYKNIIQFEYSGNPKYLFECESEKDEAFLNILRLGQNESYIDLGAYKGDTINEFLKYTKGNYKNIIAVEPEIKNFKKLSENTAGLKNISLINEAIWLGDGTLGFIDSGGRSSAIEPDNKDKAVKVNSVDNILDGRKTSYIKADTEGSEEKMLDGAADTVKAFKPKLNIAAYHRIKDLFLLPEKIHCLNPEYKIYLRHHPYIPAWDTNIYCI